MNINRNNYEVFFLLYIDRELNAEERQAVESFLRENPDLQMEMDMLASTTLPEDLSSAVFPDKSKLYRTEDTSSPVTILNYESYFVQYADDELNNEEKAATEKFVYVNPEFQAEFELIQQTKLSPDNTLVFPGKDKLYRKESANIRPLFPVWIRYAAAAMVILTLGLFWMSRQEGASDLSNSQPGVIAKNPVQQTEQPAETIASGKTPGESVPEQYELAKNSRPVPVATETTVEVKPEKQGSKLEASLPEQSAIAKIPGSNTIAEKIEDPIAGSLAINSLAANEKAIIPVQIDDEPVIIVAVNDNSGDDNSYAPGKELIRKTPLRGLLRKAGRIVGKTNPFSEDRAKGGVFTASNEQ
ncbi:MAG: hypothetical protein JNK20_05790 [Flavipsychrobacter sp.]|nr:hypothetical protein [Flavipsychrobacter sp.]